MIVKGDYIFMPIYPMTIYIPDGTFHRNKKVALWYAYLKWREEMEKNIKVTGSLESVKKLFPNKEFEFTYNRNTYKFLPDFEVTYKGIRKKTYHSLTHICGVEGRMFRRLFHKYPMLDVRIIEPLEHRNIIKNLEEAGIDFTKLLRRDI